jgi:N-acetylmuramoyl-L-alanine amidase
MLLHRFISILLAVLLTAFNASAQTSLRQQAVSAYETAAQQEASVRDKPASERTRAAYLRVIRLYERVYLITPHSGYADNALINIAALYQEIDDARDAIRTLEFLVREYPGSRFISNAREKIVRLSTSPDKVDSLPSETVDPGADASRSDRTSLVSVDRIRYWESPKSVRVVVDLDGEAQFTQGDVKTPPRVFLDIEGARLDDDLRTQGFPVESVMLENIRVAQHDESTVRVVLDLVQLQDVTTFTLRDPDRLVIDVLGTSPPPRIRTATAEASPPPTVPEAMPESPEEELSPPSETRVGTPAQPTTRGDHSLIRSLGLKIARVVIDAGHGGRDTGTIGPTGLTEKELVIDVARRLKERIESEIGAEVVMTRDDDSFVPLETRTAMANQAEADLFISIHANASRSWSIRGVETYFLNFTTSNEGLELAARENASSLRSISELQDIVSKIMLRDKVDESREFASHIQKSLAKRKHFGTNRGVKQAPFVVLIGANMPSILAEISFISNPEDERMLKGTDRRQQIAEALFEGVISYSDTLSGFTTAKAQQ